MAINKLAQIPETQITTILINGFLVDCARNFIFYYVSIASRQYEGERQRGTECRLWGWQCSKTDRGGEKERQRNIEFKQSVRIRPFIFIVSAATLPPPPPHTFV